MATYRAAIIGAGGISARHIKGWQAHPDVDLTAIADISEAAAQSRAEEFGIEKVYTEYPDLLDSEKPDLISICTWMITHAEIGVAAARAGVKGILCEKPFAGSLREIDRMLNAAGDSGTRIAVGHHHRFNPVLEQARRLISEGAIGEPTLLHRRTGGGLLNNGSHTVDIARYLLGDPNPVWALAQVARDTDRYERHAPIEDLCGGIVAFDGGARLVLESDLPEPDPPGEGRSAHVYGTEGAIMAGFKELRLLNGETGAWKTLPTESADVGVLQAAELVDWIEGRVETHRNAAENNRTTIETLMGLYESARAGNLATFPLTSGPSPLRQMIKDGALPVTVPGKYDIRIQDPGENKG